MPAPLSPTRRAAIADDIRAGKGRNAIARDHGISPGTVTTIARREHLWFEQCTRTAAASEARRIDCEAIRVRREQELLDQYLALPTTIRSDGRETRTARRLSYQLYDLHRHHNRR
jgi:transposase-like protein